MSAAAPLVTPLLKCIGCGHEIADQYYLAGTKVVCAACRAQVAAAPKAPLGSALVRSALFGIGGAIAGAAAWATIVSITNMQIGIVAIGVGLLVGVAVRKGAGARSGALFQTIAIVLTICSLAWSTIPAIYEYGASQPGGLGYPTPHAGAPVLRVKITRAAQLVAEGEPTTLEELQPKFEALSKQGGGVWYFREGRLEGVAPPPIADQLFKAIGDRRIPVVSIETESDLARAPDDPPPQAPMPWGRVVLGFVVFSFLAYGLLLKSDPFSIVFLAIALYEAWKINRRREVSFTGPHARSDAIDFSTP